MLILLVVGIEIKGIVVVLGDKENGSWVGNSESLLYLRLYVDKMKFSHSE